MTVFAFPCVTFTRSQGPSNILRQQDPVEGHSIHHESRVEGCDLYTIAVAAAAKLGVSVDSCRFTLRAPACIPPIVFLDVDHRGGDRACVGPMSGPLPPPEMSPGVQYPLGELLDRLTGAHEPLAEVGEGALQPQLRYRGLYLIVVTCSDDENARVGLPALPSDVVARWLAARPCEVRFHPSLSDAEGAQASSAQPW